MIAGVLLADDADGSTGALHRGLPREEFDRAGFKPPRAVLPDDADADLEPGGVPGQLSCFQFEGRVEFERAAVGGQTVVDGAGPEDARFRALRNQAPDPAGEQETATGRTHVARQ